MVLITSMLPKKIASGTIYINAKNRLHPLGELFTFISLPAYAANTINNKRNAHIENG
jgi:hypothetical protein